MHFRKNSGSSVPLFISLLGASVLLLIFGFEGEFGTVLVNQIVKLFGGILFMSSLIGASLSYSKLVERVCDLEAYAFDSYDEFCAEQELED